MAYNPPIGSIYHLYTTYILPSGGLYATYHLLWEPETRSLLHFEVDFEPVMESQNGAAIALLIRYLSVGDRINVLECKGRHRWMGSNCELFFFWVGKEKFEN